MKNVRLFDVFWALLFVALISTNWLLGEERDAWKETAHRATDALEVCVTQYQNVNELNGDLLRALRNPPSTPDGEGFPLETD